MNRLNKAEPAIFVSFMCSLPPEDLYLELILLSIVFCNLYHFRAVKERSDILLIDYIEKDLKLNKNTTFGLYLCLM